MREFVVDFTPADAKLLDANRRQGESYGALVVRALVTASGELPDDFSSRGPQPIAAGFVTETRPGRAPMRERVRRHFRMSEANAEALAALMDRCGVDEYTLVIERAVQLAFAPKK